jgi:hypothetical protein
MVLLLWPLKLLSVVISRVYSYFTHCLVHSGDTDKPVAPPAPWLLTLLSLPFRLLNPAATIGGSNIIASSSSTDTDTEKRPVLFIGNHSVYGLDHMPLLYEIQQRTGKCPVELYDQAFTQLPFWRQLAGIVGGVVATRSNYDKLAELIVYFPGGVRECYRSSIHEDHNLRWNEEFAKVQSDIS